MPDPRHTRCPPQLLWLPHNARARVAQTGPPAREAREGAAPKDQSPANPVAVCGSALGSSTTELDPFPCQIPYFLKLDPAILFPSHGPPWPLGYVCARRGQGPPAFGSQRQSALAALQPFVTARICPTTACPTACPTGSNTLLLSPPRTPFRPPSHTSRVAATPPR